MRFTHLPACSLAVLLAACGGPEPVVAAKAPHGGTLAGLPDGLGNVEVVRQDLPGEAQQAKLILYFLGPDGQPMTPSPTAAALKPKERAARPVEFKPSTDADPARAGALENAPIGSAGEIDGALTFTIGGRPIRLSIGVR